MNGSELLLKEIERRAQIEEDIRESQGSTLNPELLAMLEMIPELAPNYAEFVIKRMAFDAEHFVGDRITKQDYRDWRRIKRVIGDYEPLVPADLNKIPRGWSRVFKDVLRLYGNPDGES